MEKELRKILVSILLLVAKISISKTFSKNFGEN